MSLLVLLAVAAASPAASAPRCVVPHAHIPAGKIVHRAPVPQCDRQEARQTERRPAPAAGGAERGVR